MKLFFKQSCKAICVALVLMMTITLMPSVPAYGANLKIDENNFPDDAFRNYVKANFDDNKDGSLDEAEIAGVVKIDIGDKDITNLKGLEYFKNLKELYCNKNKITSLDVSKNSNLETLYCSNNELTELNVRENAKLEILVCSENKIKSLDVFNNHNLKQLWCRANKLKDLDIKANTKLETLYCNNNEITSLDVSNNSKLKTIWCNNNKLVGLDLKENANLERLACSNNTLAYLDISNNPHLEELLCANNRLEKLDTKKQDNLNSLDCSKNKITSLDVSNNHNLKQLWCNNNKLKDLNIKANTRIEELDCAGNELTSLDLSNNTNIVKDYAISCKEQVYAAKYRGDRVKFADMPKGFEKDKVSDITGGSIEGETFKINGDSLTYKYDTGLNVKGNKIFLETKLLKAHDVTPQIGGMQGRDSNETGKLKAAKENAAKAVDELLNAQNFSGKELEKAENIKKDFREKLEKVKNVEEVEKLKEETIAKGNALWSDEELTLKAKVKAIGKADFIVKSKFIKTKKGVKVVKISWQKIDDIDFDGYEVYRSTRKSKFGNKPIITANGTKTSCYDIKKLNKSKIYYYRIKAFKHINGEKIYTDWSNKTWQKFKK